MILAYLTYLPTKTNYEQLELHQVPFSIHGWIHEFFMDPTTVAFFNIFTCFDLNATLNKTLCWHDYHSLWLISEEREELLKKLSSRRIFSFLLV